MLPEWTGIAILFAMLPRYNYITIIANLQYGHTPMDTFTLEYTCTTRVHSVRMHVGVWCVASLTGASVRPVLKWRRTLACMYTYCTCTSDHEFKFTPLWMGCSSE